jgi:uncharacterized membrane-anchored protein
VSSNGIAEARIEGKELQCPEGLTFGTHIPFSTFMLSTPNGEEFTRTAHKLLTKMSGASARPPAPVLPGVSSETSALAHLSYRSPSAVLRATHCVRYAPEMASSG